jgi:hypothetical protein
MAATSETRSCFTTHPTCKGLDKPLEPYKPNAYRSMNKPADFKPPYRNASSIQLGRSGEHVSAASRFRTSNQATFTPHSMRTGATTNPGIHAMQTSLLKRTSER